MLRIITCFVLLTMSSLIYGQKKSHLKLSEPNIDSLSSYIEQNRPVRRTDAEKDSLRQLYNKSNSSSIQFTKRAVITMKTQGVNITMTKEEDISSAGLDTVVLINFYNGVESEYNEHTYTKPKK